MAKKIKIIDADLPIIASADTAPTELLTRTVKANLASELKAAYADAADLVTVWRAIRMGAQMEAKRTRLFAVLDAIAKTEG